MKKNIKKIVGKIIRLLPVDKKMVVFESEGDLSDNSYALYEYMLKQEYDKKFCFVWFVENVHQAPKNKNTKYVGKSGKINTVRKMIYLAKAKYYIYDHCNYFDFYNFKKRDGQVIVNLWHGNGVKSTSYASRSSSADILITTGRIFNEELSKILGVSREKIYSIGYPRTDYFYKRMNKSQIKLTEEFARYNKVFLWMPTFRRSNNAELDEAYFHSYTGLPILMEENELEEFDFFLKEINALCIFKIHHLQAELPAFKKQFTNILIWNDKDIRNMGLQLYQFVVLTDFLITDYSSIATDYMLLNKPIIYTLDDYDEYDAARGFIFDNCMEYFPGEKAFNKEDLFSSINGVVQGHDRYQEERIRINNLFNKYQDGNNCERILSAIGID